MSDQMYQRQELMEIYKNPVNRGKLTDPTAEATEKNPMCGDVVELTLKIEDGIITGAKFEGAACFVSIVSSSLVTEEITGKTLEEAKELNKQDILDMIGIELTTSRVKCATLVLDALQKAIKNYEQ